MLLRTRRLVPLALFVLSAPVVAQPSPTSRVFCLQHGLTASAFSPGEITTTTGVIPLDFIIAEQSVRLRSEFGILPELYYMMGSATRNAYASSEKNSLFSAGTVFLGRDLLLAELAPSEQGYPAIAGILAHEFAHVLQMMRNGSISNSAMVELHADYLAGYYLGRRGYVPKEDVGLFARSLYTAGDPEGYYDMPDHGTGDQRVAAMLAGYHHPGLTLNQAFDSAGVRAQELLGSFQDLGSGLPELAADEHDPVARQALDSRGRPTQVNQSLQDPYGIFSYVYRNTGGRTLIVKSVVETRIAPVVGQDAPEPPTRVLTHRAYQFRLLPGETRTITGKMRLTGQSDVVRSFVEPREIVRFEPATPELPAES